MRVIPTDSEVEVPQCSRRSEDLEGERGTEEIRNGNGPSSMGMDMEMRRATLVCILYLPHAGRGCAAALGL